MALLIRLLTTNKPIIGPSVALPTGPLIGRHAPMGGAWAQKRDGAVSNRPVYGRQAGPAKIGRACRSGADTGQVAIKRGAADLTRRPVTVVVWSFVVQCGPAWSGAVWWSRHERAAPREDQDGGAAGSAARRNGTRGGRRPGNPAEVAVRDSGAAGTASGAEALTAAAAAASSVTQPTL